MTTMLATTRRFFIMMLIVDSRRRKELVLLVVPVLFLHAALNPIPWGQMLVVIISTRTMEWLWIWSWHVQAQLPQLEQVLILLTALYLVPIATLTSDDVPPMMLPTRIFFCSCSPPSSPLPVTPMTTSIQRQQEEEEQWMPHSKFSSYSSSY